MGFNTYDHVASRTMPSLNSLGSYCCRRTRRMTYSYPNSFCTAEYQAYPRGPIYSLGLSIGLGMISRTEVQMGIHGFVQSLPEFWNKLGSSSGHIPLGHAMWTDYPRPIKLSLLQSSVGHLVRYEVSYLGQLIHNYAKGIISRLNPRQSHDKIHSILFPLSTRVLARVATSQWVINARTWLSDRCRKKQHTRQHLSSFHTTNRLPWGLDTSYSLLDEWYKRNCEPLEVSYHSITWR
jgi:hypothetical protein